MFLLLLATFFKENFSHFPTLRRGGGAGKRKSGFLKMLAPVQNFYPPTYLPPPWPEVPLAFTQKTQINEAICCALSLSFFLSLSCLISDAKAGAENAAGRSQVENFLPPAIENC